VCLQREEQYVKVGLCAAVAVGRWQGEKGKTGDHEGESCRDLSKYGELRLFQITILQRAKNNQVAIG